MIGSVSGIRVVYVSFIIVCEYILFYHISITSILY